MEKSVKKEIFFMILKSLFNDNTNEIRESKCIPFYHFLIDTLEQEIMEIPNDKIDDISLCHSIIELLCNFDLMNVDLSFWTSENISNFLQDYSGLNDENFKSSLSKFRKIYIFIKDEFILG